MSGFDEPVPLDDGRTGHWKAVHPEDVDRIDDNGHVVKARETRLWVEDQTGKATKAGHGHPRRYYCVKCAVALGAGEPPKRWF